MSYLEIFLGPMFSGKTTKLIDLYKKYTYCNMKVCVINHSLDTRYDKVQMSTHDGILVPCIFITSILPVYNYSSLDEPIDNIGEHHLLLQNADVILINEGQFFDDLYVSVLEMLKDNKKIYVSGLDGDFQQNKFGSLLDLIPHCDKVTKLTSLCSLCKNGTPGLFSMRLTNEKEQMLIGSSNYIPVCRYCYEENEQS
jgi:thymidine kinase